MLEQKATVTQLTASKDENNSPPTIPLMTLSLKLKPSGRFEVKESRYTLPKNVEYKINKINIKSYI